MSDSNHTRGPWVWHTSNSWKRLKHDSNGLLMNVLEPYVCRDMHPDITISEADMALIAAAPNLLDALQELEACGVLADESLFANKLARVAIAKAEGTGS